VRYRYTENDAVLAVIGLFTVWCGYNAAQSSLAAASRSGFWLLLTGLLCIGTALIPSRKRTQLEDAAAYQILSLVAFPLALVNVVANGVLFGGVVLAGNISGETSSHLEGLTGLAFWHFAWTALFLYGMFTWPELLRDKADAAARHAQTHAAGDPDATTGETVRLNEAE
jgi:hypothetical protein